MILADKIIEHRKKKGWSQEDLADKLDVSRQSVSKWESAQSQPDLNKIIKMSELFNVSTDYLLKNNEQTSQSETLNNNNTSTIKYLSDNKADEYLINYEKSSKRIALGTSLSIISLSLIALINANISSSIIITLLVIALILSIGYALFSFIVGGSTLTKLDYINKEDYKLNDSYILKLENSFKDLDKNLTIKLAVATTLLVISFITFVVIANIITEEYTNFLFSFMLILNSIFIHIIIKTMMIKGSYKRLFSLSYLDNNITKKSAILDFIIITGWVIVAIAYLIYSITTAKWYISWIVFPIYGGFVELIQSVYKIKK